VRVSRVDLGAAVVPALATFNIPNVAFTAVEFPGRVLHADKAIDMLGGEAAISAVCNIIIGVV